MARVLERSVHKTLAYGFMLLTSTMTVAFSQVRVEISLEQNQYLCYEPTEIKVTVTNQMSEPLEMARMSKEEPWLNFFVTTTNDEEIPHSNQPWAPPRLILLPGQVKSVAVNLLPFFLIREAGEYRVRAIVSMRGKHFQSAPILFKVVNGTTIWQQEFTAPPSAGDPSKSLRPRLYSLVVHRPKDVNMLYTRIQDVEGGQVYCTTVIGELSGPSEPRARIDKRGDFHLFHQGGGHIFTYVRFSPMGKNVGTRFFSNMFSMPTMVTDENHETEIIGGEEVFMGKDQSPTMIPTAPVASPAR